MRASQCDNDFQLQVIVVFSDNGYQYQLKKVLKSLNYYIHLKHYMV